MEQYRTQRILDVVRGEPTSGSITNQFGDKIKRTDVTAIRMIARLIANTAKILIRKKR